MTVNTAKRVLLGGILAMLVYAPAASAQDATEEGPDQGSEEGTQTAEPRYDENLDQAARLTFQSARQAFLAGDYELALERFQQAYRLSPRPMLLFNIAATLDRLRRDEETVVYLRRYLEEQPMASDRTEVEARIRVLEAAIEERRASQPDPEPDPEPEIDPATVVTPDPEPEPDITPAPEAEGSSGLPMPIVLATAGAAVVAGGLVIWSGLDAVSKNDDYEAYVTGAGANLSQGEALLADVESAETRTNVLIGVTATLGVAAGVLAIFTDWGSDDTEEPTVTPEVAVGADGFFVGATQRF